MKFETLKNNKKILLVTVIVFVVILTLIITTSLAKYKVTESINIASGTINYSPSDLNLMAVYLEGDSGYALSDTIPESGYSLNSEESYCKIGDTIQDVTISYDVSIQMLTIIPMTSKGMKCYLYFDESFCGTHNVTTVLGTLAVNDCEPIYGVTSEQADAGEACLYNGEAVSSAMGESITQETCQTVYKVSGMSYMDSTLTQVFTYVGEATWDSTTSTCTYDGTTLADFQGNAIVNAEDCVEVYSFNGTNVSGIENIGSGTWGPISGGTGIYETQDEEGTSYYYRGSTENNYVKFANKYWRLVRINGNGSLRLIYSGEVSTIDAAGKETILANGYNDADTDYTQIGTSAFNASPNYNDNAYVGFMYGTAGSSTYAETHANTNSSTIKTYLETWYNNNLASYAEYLDTESGFCNDRSLNSGTGIGTTETYYSAYNKIWSIKNPTLKCQNTNDYFTIKNSNKGNKALTYPIGLLTVDEAMYAGGTAANNSSYYLYTGNYYWTMSPYDFDGAIAGVFHVYSDGSLNGYSVYNSVDGVRPVINVKTDQLTISGSGTISNPYVIS